VLGGRGADGYFAWVLEDTFQKGGGGVLGKGAGVMGC